MLRLDDPGLLRAARAAGYRSKRLGVALYVLEVLAAAGGDEVQATALLSAAIVGTGPQPEPAI